MKVRRLLDDLEINFSISVERASHSAFLVWPTTTTEVSNLYRTLDPLVQQKEVSIHLHGARSIPNLDIARPFETVTVDLRLLTGISLNTDKRVVSVHVGETWSSVQQELEKYGLSLLQGDGLVDFTSRGVAHDSIEEFEVVLTSGAVLRANAVENTAIWQAIQADSDYGAVVTSFKVRAHESNTPYGGIAHYVPESFSLLAEASVLFAKTESSSDTRVMFSAGCGYGYRLSTCCYFHNKGIENQTLPQPFASLPGRVQHHVPSQTRSGITICEEFAGAKRDSVRSLNATCMIRPHLALILDIHQEWLEVSRMLDEINDHMFSIAFSPMANVAQPNAQGSHEKDVLFTVMLSSTWKSIADDERVRRGIDMILAKSWAMSRARNLQYGSVFADYAHYSGFILHEYGGKDTVFPLYS